MQARVQHLRTASKPATDLSLNDDAVIGSGREAGYGHSSHKPANGSAPGGADNDVRINIPQEQIAIDQWVMNTGWRIGQRHQQNWRHGM
jgi:hypothetical protein